MKIKLPFDNNYIVSQLFGNPQPMYTNLGLKGHNGIDFVCPTGTPIKASIAGKVEFVGEDSSAGKGVYIISDLGDKTYRCIYWHLQSFNCKVGDSVEEGDVIGISDNTGMSTAPHLHFGMKQVELKNGWWQDINHDNGYNGSCNPFPFFTDLDLSVFSNRIGARGQFVYEIQRFLNRQGYKLIEDGNWGKLTDKAVKDFQSKHGLVSDGVCGKKTLAVIMSL